MWNDKHRNACNAAQRKYRANNTEKARAATRKSRWKKFNATPEMVEDALRKQEGRCAVCGTEEFPGIGYHVDHCHSTNTLRGILCLNCNALLGHAKDSVDVLASAISYLKQFEERHVVH